MPGSVFCPWAAIGCAAALPWRMRRHCALLRRHCAWRAPVACQRPRAGFPVHGLESNANDAAAPTANISYCEQHIVLPEECEGHALPQLLCTVPCQRVVIAWKACVEQWIPGDVK
jgi:hypothetical protein